MIANGGNVTMTAGQTVILKPGFEVQAGGALQAGVDPALDTGGGGGQSGPAWRLTVHSYDAEGRVDQTDVLAPDLGQTTLSYAYDRQDRPTWRKTQLASGGAFYQWYTYNARGLLTQVYASTSSAQPSTPEVSYTYTADGQVASADYRDGLSPVARSHDVRGRLTDIGNVGSSAIPFSARYTYFPNGTVRKAQSRQPWGDHAQTRYRYLYSYDPLARVTEANYSYYAGGWQSTPHFDVPLVSYDTNGNIERLQRRGNTNSASTLHDNLDYTYDTNQGRPNRLLAVDDLTTAANGDGFHDWDAGDVPANKIDYDAVGNLTTFDAAPYDLSSLEYDERNLLTELTADGTTVTYRYSLGGQRTYKQNGANDPEYYVLDGSVTLGVVTGSSLDS